MTKARGPYRVDPLGYKKKALANVATNDTSQERVDKTEKQRHWVELTDDEISACSKGNMTRSGFARTIEAKLREKNT